MVPSLPANNQSRQTSGCFAFLIEIKANELKEKSNRLLFFWRELTANMSRSVFPDCWHNCIFSN